MQVYNIIGNHLIVWLHNHVIIIDSAETFKLYQNSNDGILADFVALVKMTSLSIITPAIITPWTYSIDL